MRTRMSDTKSKSSKHMNYGLLLHFSFPYLCILLVLVILSTTITNVTFESQLEQSMEYSNLCLRVSMDRLNDSLSSVQTLSKLLSDYAPLHDAMCAFNEKERLQKLLVLRDELIYQSDPLNILEGYMVVGNDCEFIVTQNRVVINPELIYEGLFKYGDMEFEEWKAFIHDGHRAVKFFPAEDVRPGNAFQSRCIVYSVPYIDAERGVVVGQMLFYLNESEILSVIANSFNNDTVIVQLMNGDKLLTGSEALKLPQAADGYEKITADGEEYYSAHLNAENFALRLVIGIPSDALLAKCRDRLALPNIILGGLILFTLTIAVMTVLKNRNSLMSLSRHIPEGKQGGLNSVAKAVQDMEDDRACMSKTIDMQKIQLREALFRQMVYGVNGNEMQLEMQLEYAGIRIGGENFNARALYLRISDDDREMDREALRSAENHLGMVTKILDDYADVFIPLLLEERNQIAILYMTEDENEVRPINELYGRIKMETGLQINFYLGGCFTQLHHIPRSFNEARRLMQTDTLQQERFLAIAQSQTDMDVFEFSAADEEKLLNLIERNEMQEIDKMLSKIYNDNFVKRSLTAQMCELLYYRLVSALVQNDDKMPPSQPELISPRGDCRSEQFFSALRSYVKTLCERSEIKRGEVRHKLDEDMLNFVKDNLSNNQLSISMLSMRYGRSESYLSMRFKEVVGATFSSYVERLRVHMASDLLQDGKKSIAEISEMVGYNSPSAFGRAYKRVMGCTPSEYQSRNTQ